MGPELGDSRLFSQRVMGLEGARQRPSTAGAFRKKASNNAVQKTRLPRGEADEIKLVKNQLNRMQNSLLSKQELLCTMIRKSQTVSVHDGLNAARHTAADEAVKFQDKIQAAFEDANKAADLLREIRAQVERKREEVQEHGASMADKNTQLRNACEKFEQQCSDQRKKVRVTLALNISEEELYEKKSTKVVFTQERIKKSQVQLERLSERVSEAATHEEQLFQEVQLSQSEDRELDRTYQQIMLEIRQMELAQMPGVLKRSKNNVVLQKDLQLLVDEVALKHSQLASLQLAVKEVRPLRQDEQESFFITGGEQG